MVKLFCEVVCYIDYVCIVGWLKFCVSVVKLVLFRKVFMFLLLCYR